MVTVMATESLGPRFDSLYQEAFLNLWRTYDRLRMLEEAVFERHNLSAQQYNALRLLRAVAPGSLPTLAMGTKLISRAPDMTRLIDKLEARGWVQRQRRAENRRVVEVAITASGLALLELLHDSVQQCAQEQLGHLDPVALRQLIELLQAARAPHEDPRSPWRQREGDAAVAPNTPVGP
jgi:DNA-binding MarR family transcriptional regulator